MSLDCVRKPERIHADTGRTCELHTDRPRPENANDLKKTNKTTLKLHAFFYLIQTKSVLSVAARCGCLRKCSATYKEICFHIQTVRRSSRCLWKIRFTFISGCLPHRFIFRKTNMTQPSCCSSSIVC